MAERLYFKAIYDQIVDRNGNNVYDCVTEEYAPQQAVTNTYPTMVDGQVQPGDVTDGGFDIEYLKEDISSILLNGQFNKYHREFVFDAIPLSYENRDRVIQNFATKSSAQKFWEKTGTKDTLRFQDRTEDSVSNRSLLANALEGAAKTDIERAKLQEYRDRAAKLDEQEKKLRELYAQIKELSFAKGPRDAKKISALRDEAIKTANRIAIHDKKLLQLEAASPLQSILKRERDKAYRRAEAKGAKALEDYKASVLARQQETVKKHREMADAIKAVSADTMMMEKEFVRLVKEYEKQEARSAKKVDAGKTTITDLESEGK